MTRAAQLTHAVSEAHGQRDAHGSSGPELDARVGRDDLPDRQGGGASMTSAGLIAPSWGAAPAARPESGPRYSCPECRHVLRVSGLGRHRVYFELDDERLADPVMDRACPLCGHRLAAKRPR